MNRARTPPLAGLLLGLAVLPSCDHPATPPAPADEALRAALQDRAQELDARTTKVGKLLPDLAFVDLAGQAGKLSDFAAHPLVIAMRDLGCPVSQRTAPALARVEDDFAPRGVAFLFLDASPQDSADELRADVAARGFEGRTVRDTDETLAAALGASTTTEVFVLDGSRTLVYCGALDDQVGRGVVQERARHRYLVDALESTLRSERVAVPATSAPGCRLALDTRPPPPSDAPTYHHEIARILRDNCIECHHTGGVAPFALESYVQARGKRAQMASVVEDGVMPPWFAAADTGPWSNDRRLSDDDKATLLAWIAAGAPEGDPAEQPLAHVYPDGWRIGEPDLVLQMKQPCEVPSEGPVPFRYFEVTPEVPADLWIQRLELRPEARQVVHHVTVSYRLPDERAQGRAQELRRTLLPWSRPQTDGWVFLFGYLPGKGPFEQPDGMATFLPKGAELRFDMHYTPNGTAVRDLTRLGLVLAPEPPELVSESRNFRDVDIVIPPGAANVSFTRDFPVNHEVYIRAVTPHMHLRGKSMLAELIHPDGSSEKLIELPAWDQNWQFDYVFRQPRRAPAGSSVRVTATYDNSRDNPVNPDPTAWVKDGPLTTDEMMSLIVQWIRPRVVAAGDDARSVD